MVTNSRTLYLVGIFLLLTVLFYQPLPVVQASKATESTPEVNCTNYKVYLPLITRGQENPPAQQSDTCLSEEEVKLGDLINRYRVEKGLAPIAFSRSLTQVAQAHVHDLYDNRPNTGDCNLHSWSDKGTWTRVCYTPDHKNAEGMWLKPQEITNKIYKDYGYEIAYWHSAQATAEGGLCWLEIQQRTQRRDDRRQHLERDELAGDGHRHLPQLCSGLVWSSR